MRMKVFFQQSLLLHCLFLLVAATGGQSASSSLEHAGELDPQVPKVVRKLDDDGGVEATESRELWGFGSYLSERYSPPEITVDRIQCPERSVTFDTLVAIQFQGKSQNMQQEQDIAALVSLLEDNFKTEAALRCDPFQRSIVTATQVLPTSPTSSNTLVCPEVENALLFQVTAESFGSKMKYPPKCLLELEPPNELTLTRRLTRDTCTLANVLDKEDNDYDDEKDECPRSGCYCPLETVASNAPSAGTTGRQLATALDTALKACQREVYYNKKKKKKKDPDNYQDPPRHKKRRRYRFNNDDKNNNKDPDYYQDRQWRKNAGRTNIFGQKRFGGGGDGGGNYNRGGGGGKEGNESGDNCPTNNINEIESVVEVQQRKCDPFVPFEAGFVTITDVDPCSIAPGTFQEYLDELRKNYNQFQFDNCDPLFRRIVEWQVVDDVCADNGGGGNRDRRLRRLTGGQPSRAGGTQTTEPTPTTGNRRKRRNRKLVKEPTAEEEATHQIRRDRKLQEIKDKAAKMPLDNEVDEEDDDRIPLGIADDLEDDSTSMDRSLGNRPYNRYKLDRSKRKKNLCFCGGCFKGTGRSITEEEFEEMAKKAMAKVTNGMIEVLTFYEVDDDFECPENEPRFEVYFELRVNFNVLVANLPPQFLADRRRDCIIQYNRLVSENCAEGFTQFRSCEITTILDFPNSLSYKIRGTAFANLNVFSSGEVRHKTRKLSSSSSSSSLSDSSFSGIQNGNDNAVPTQTRRHRHRRDEVVTDPVDVCRCKDGGGSGINPTLHEYAQALMALEESIVSVVVEM